MLIKISISRVLSILFLGMLMLMSFVPVYAAPSLLAEQVKAANTQSPLQFAPGEKALGLNITNLTVSSAGASTTMRDIVLVIDTTSFMAFATSGNPNMSDPGDDPALCNVSHTCQPLEAIKSAAIDFIDLLSFPSDRVGIVTLTSQNPAGSRTPITILSISSNKFDVLYALGHLDVFEPPSCDSLYGVCRDLCTAAEISDANNSGNVSNPCYQRAEGYYVGQSCPVFQSTGDPSSCTSTDVGTSLQLAGSEFSRGEARQNAQQIIVALVSGPANASVDGSDIFSFGFCPPSTWNSPTSPFCRDASSLTRHPMTDVNYDADDYARDMADFVTNADTGLGVKVFTIGLGNLIRNTSKGDPDAGEKLLQYISLAAGGDNANHGDYFYAPDTSALQPIFQYIADEINVPPVVPVIHLVPATLDFGEQLVGTTSSARTVTLTNTGAADLIIGTLGSVSGFTVSNDLCSSHTILATESCTFEVAFSTLASGVKSDTLSIPSNAPTSPDLVTLNGTGIAPAATFSLSSFNFGSQMVGSTSPAQTITMTNTGTGDLIIGMISKTGDFTVSNDLCGLQTIAASDTCTFDVTFSPTSIGPKDGSVSIPDNTSNSPHHISLHGRGGVACTPAITVANNNNSGTGTLRQALIDLCPGGMITFAPSLSGQTIFLASTLEIDNSLSIDGSALALPITISGDKDNNSTSDVRVFFVFSNITVTLDSLRISKGYGVWKGGGIYNDGTLMITNSTLSGNTANEFDIDNGIGGAIYNGITGTLTVTNSTFVGNHAPEKGGGIFNEGATTIMNSTFSNNSSYSGGGIYNYNGGLNLYNTILANSINDEDCYNYAGTVTGNNNIIETDGMGVNACGTTIPLNLDPQLGALTGSPAYFPLNSSSPAIDAGDDPICATAPVSNSSQNGMTRPQGVHCDIGSFEFIDTTLPTVLSIIRTDANPTASAQASFLATFSEAVLNVDKSDFTLSTTELTRVSVYSVSGSGATRTIIVNTGIGDGTVLLNLVDNDTIMDVASNALGGVGAGNANFSSEAYIIDKPDFRAPVLRSPRSNVLLKYNLPSFWWTSIQGAQNYEIQLAEDVLFTVNVDSEIVIGSPYNVVIPLSDGTYYWRVRAYNASNKSGSWSPYRTLTIDTTVPPTPVLNSPASNSSTRSIPIFRWQSVDTAVAYQFQFDNAPGFTSPNYSVTTRGNFRRPPVMKVGAYYWRVRAKDAAGNWSAWSASRTINITGP